MTFKSIFENKKSDVDTIYDFIEKSEDNEQKVWDYVSYEFDIYYNDGNDIETLDDLIEFLSKKQLKELAASI